MTKAKTTFDNTGDSITGDIHEWIAYLEKKMDQLTSDHAIEKQAAKWTLEGINIDTEKAGREASAFKMGTSEVYMKKAADKLEKLRVHYKNMETVSQECLKIADEHRILTARVRDSVSV